jgi:hypothetical protein
MSSASLIPSSFSSTTMSLRTRLPHRSDYGVGAGTGISGFRANLGVGDDLFGSREDAIRRLVELHGGGILHEKATDLRVHNNPDGKYLIMVVDRRCGGSFAFARNIAACRAS